MVRSQQQSPQMMSNPLVHCILCCSARVTTKFITSKVFRSTATAWSSGVPNILSVCLCWKPQVTAPSKWLFASTVPPPPPGIESPGYHPWPGNHQAEVHRRESWLGIHCEESWEVPTKPPWQYPYIPILLATASSHQQWCALQNRAILCLCGELSRLRQTPSGKTW